MDPQEIIAIQLQQSQELLASPILCSGIVGGYKLVRHRIKQEEARVNRVANRLMENAAAGVPPNDNTLHILRSSNMPLIALQLDLAARVEGLVGMDMPFRMNNTIVGPSNFRVHVVSHGGKQWWFVCSRSARDLHLEWLAGCRSWVDKAREAIDYSRSNLVEFSAPRVTIYFSRGVSEIMACKIKMCGAHVDGEYVPGLQRIDDESDSDNDDDVNDDDDDVEAKEKNIVCDDKESLEEPTMDENIVNLDVTALVALSSAMCQPGGHMPAFHNQRIHEQAAAEARGESALLQIREVLDGKRAIVCESALACFKSILDRIGGPGEQKRFQEIDFAVVSDHVTDRVARLPFTHGFSVQQRAVFGTGDAFRCVTLTANMAAVRSARAQNVALCVVEHPPRPLTEVMADRISRGLPESHKCTFKNIDERTREKS